MYQEISNILNEAFGQVGPYVKVSHYLKRAAQERDPLRKQKFLNLAKQWRIKASRPKGAIIK